MDDFMLVAPKKKPKRVRESKIEGAHRVKRVEAAGGLSLKWVSPGYAGVPDRIEMFNIDGMVEFLDLVGSPISREVAVKALATVIQFTEYKAGGEKPKPRQDTVHSILRTRGFTVNVIDKQP